MIRRIGGVEFMLFDLGRGARTKRINFSFSLDDSWHSLYARLVGRWNFSRSWKKDVYDGICQLLIDEERRTRRFIRFNYSMEERAEKRETWGGVDRCRNVVGLLFREYANSSRVSNAPRGFCVRQSLEIGLVAFSRVVHIILFWNAMINFLRVRRSGISRNFFGRE